jgi:hypothetical protein
MDTTGATAGNSEVADLVMALQTKTDDASMRQSLQIIGDILKTGNITNSSGVAIGHNIRQVINHFDLPAEIVARLLDLRTMLGTSLGLENSRYRWDTLMAEKIQGFVGREFVFQAIDQFLAKNTNGYLTIVGDPGIGKSSILAEYVRRTGCLAHFNIRALGITGSGQFLQNICAQIIADAQLLYSQIPAEAMRDGAFLLQLLREASQKLDPGDRLVIAVDALDEVDLSAHPDGANVLFLPNILPAGVFFILTRRQVDIPFVTMSIETQLDLMTYPNENLSDIQLYLRKAMANTKLRTWIQSQNLSDDDFVKTLSRLSENNFMYLRYVLPDIEDGAYQELGVSSLPHGLEKYYEDHWRHMGMKTKPVPRVKLRIIYILCEVQQPVSRRLITRFANTDSLHVDELMVQEVLDEWQQFLHLQQTMEGKQFSIYHASFRDFLYRKDVVQAAEVSIIGINALIADPLWKIVSGGDE